MMEDKTRNANCCSVNRFGAVQTSKEERKKVVEKDQGIDGMVFLDSGEFLMGSDDDEGFKSDGEGPVRKVKVSEFYIDIHAVTNIEFKAFVDDTGYKTDAEKFGWSFVFYQFVPKELDTMKVIQTPWWLGVKDAYWYQPEGGGSSIEDRLSHPVIHVTWNDVIAYCKWAGKRLPTEVEWEYAARGGLVQKRFPWGNELTPNGEHYCNIWQGNFPHTNTKVDGYTGTAPAQSFPPNNYGLYNVSGNVWEWCANDFDIDRRDKIDNDFVSGDVLKAMRGGSYLCHQSYCNRYRVAARSANTVESSSGNIGFRCVKDVVTN